MRHHYIDKPLKPKLTLIKVSGNFLKWLSKLNDYDQTIMVYMLADDGLLRHERKRRNQLLDIFISELCGGK